MNASVRGSRPDIGSPLRVCRPDREESAHGVGLRHRPEDPPLAAGDL
jgi:hypothetical protein